MTRTPCLYIVERTPLADLAHAIRVPAKGDSVVFLRDAQDLDGSVAMVLRGRGVRVIWGPELLETPEIRDIEAFLNGYIKGWFVRDGKDLSKDGDLSLGQFLSGQLASMQKPPLIVVLGEICRKALAGMAPGG
ncbi:MAG: hypothetical protein O3A85_14260, partial [Proteobacteria bacterium]|nr:hypothetical protein [Pseudomonadota bacterium]